MAGSRVPAVPESMRRAILEWFDADARSLAFRGSTDPWAILVSEAMAQQTQAARAAEAWTRFLAAFPTAAALAEASPADVLRAWRGLGYNRRALALRAAAIAIVADHGGRVPGDLDALQRLPGVGPYTGRAVAALAFGRRVGAVDTNVRRVLNRAVGGQPDAFTPGELQAVADASVPAERPGVWTHALMDLGATLCRPRAPRCGVCPARPWCRAAQRGTTERPRATRTNGSGTVRAVPEPAAPFVTTSRWLRGRILEVLRDAEAGAWARIETPFGAHDAPAVEVAIRSLARDGLLERHAEDPNLARLPLV
ncbi:MAG: A/G-specific adenine glycosylase [Chloroflexi bacterium]|nr:A/G-specific adenine glycosylase [Chloroflexota bacterium]